MADIPQVLDDSAAVSQLGCAELFFVEPRVKVDGKYYCEVLPVTRRIVGNIVVF